MQKRGLAVLLATVILGSSLTAAGGETVPLPFGAKLPAFELVYESEVTISPPVDFGDTLEGHRRVIPITGGSFRGPTMRGTVMAGGADWNLTRRDGGSSVEADYYLRTDDGVVIRIHNQGVTGPANTPPAAEAPEIFYMYTTPTFEAPGSSRYDWMNRAVFFGTLQGRKGRTDAVLIRVFRLL
ncbi:MAG: hypothetical protein RLZZ200_1606 [Pseudomonadota bacterium]|jgi:hypothetical protein